MVAGADACIDADGTAIESFSKLGDSIYFHHPGQGESADADGLLGGGGGAATMAGPPHPVLWVVQFISSELRWAAGGVHLRQRAGYTPDSTALNFSLTIVAAPGRKAALHAATRSVHPMSAAAATTINIRIPSWAVAARSSLTLNGASLLPAVSGGGGSGDHGQPSLLPGKFLSLTRRFAHGDVIAGSFAMEARLEPINDNRTEFKDVAAIMWGPVLLAGLTAAPTFALRAERAAIGSWLHAKPGMHFTAPGNWSLRPLNTIVDEAYTAYFNVSQTATG